MVWVGLFRSVLYFLHLFVPSEIPKCFVVVYQCFDLDGSIVKVFKVCVYLFAFNVFYFLVSVTCSKSSGGCACHLFSATPRFLI